MSIEDILRNISSDGSDSEEELFLKKNLDQSSYCSCKNGNFVYHEPEKSPSLMTRLHSLNWKNVAIMSCLAGLPPVQHVLLHCRTLLPT